MNRIDRLSAILIQLQSRRITKAKEIADRFSISLRTVYRDVKSLELAGIPIMGEAGVGYSIMDGYRLPPIMFTKEEAISFLTAEKLVEKFTDYTNAAFYKSAMYKIKAVLRTTEKELLESIECQIEVLKDRNANKFKPDLNLIQPILRSIADKTVLSLEYFANYRQAYSKRQIEPVGVIYLDNYWHLIAFCRMRNDYRDFRLDRISNLFQQSEIFENKHPSLKECLKNQYQDIQLIEVVIQVEKRIECYIKDEKYYHGFISEYEYNKCILEMHFLTASLEGFARWYLMFGEYCIIIKPDSLKLHVQDMIKKISSKLADS